jgi:hypothetical protein
MTGGTIVIGGRAPSCGPRYGFSCWQIRCHSTKSSRQKRLLEGSGVDQGAASDLE